MCSIYIVGSDFISILQTKCSDFIVKNAYVHSPSTVWA